MQRKDKVFLFINNKGWKDCTDEIKAINNFGNHYEVIFKSNKKYPFSYENLETLQNGTEVKDIDPFLLGQYREQSESHLYKSNNKYYILDKADGLSNCSLEYIKEFKDYAKGQQSVFNYFYSLAKVKDQGTNSNFLESQYGQIQELWYNPDNVLNSILKKKLIKRNHEDLIYPFSYNLSQIQAIEKGLSNNISIIQGPPGTGKTQTILNILANIIKENKTVAVISNNNIAVYNVYEKMEAAGYGFLCASLGNLGNRELFFSNQHNFKRLETYKEYGDINDLIEQEKNVFEKESNIASLINEKEKIEQEYKKYTSIYKNTNVKINKRISPQQVLELAVKLEDYGKDSLRFLKKMFLSIKYKISISDLNGNIPELTEKLENIYIKRKIQGLEDRILDNENYIKQHPVNVINERVSKLSKNLLNKYLNTKINPSLDSNYSIDDFKSRFKSFIERYPVILSSTYCLPTTVPDWFTFDYLIIDEASQSTITTVLPSLAKGKNIIVIGDDKQLPPVLEDKELKYEDKIHSSYNITSELRDNGQSFLSFIQRHIPWAPQTLLKEHYRCPKQIIGFSNERIYNDKLELKKKEDKKDHLQIIKTVPGNHARKNDTHGTGLYNQREIDEIKNLIKKTPSNNTVGVITPYRRQAELLRNVLPENIEVGTIHTYQGKEKQIIILSTVANDAEDFKKGEDTYKSFVNNEQLINVAITRAQDKFVLVTSDKIANSNNGILADLVKYICYQTETEITEGSIKSVFDILYDDYGSIRRKIVDDLDSRAEEIIRELIISILEEDHFSSLSYSSHVRLNKAIKVDSAKYTKEEAKYLMHPWTHLDFVIYNRYDKKPILAIEVDGTSFHEQNIKQSIHDKIKDKCLNNANLPLIRLKTNDSREESKIINKLNEIICK